jgi:hypothetical protein
MASDVSNFQIPDVAKTLDYLKYRRKLNVNSCFPLIIKDHVHHRTLENNPNSAMIRKFDNDRQGIENDLRGKNVEIERKYFGCGEYYLFKTGSTK